MKYKSTQQLFPVYRRLLSNLMLIAIASFTAPLLAGEPMPQPLDLTATDISDSQMQGNALPDAQPNPSMSMNADAMPMPSNFDRPAMNNMRFVTLGRVLFASGKWVLTDDAKRALDRVAEYLSTHPGTDRLLLDGHTDKVGGNAYNDALSDKRAIAVETYLISKGLDPQLIHWKGHGKRAPIDENWTRLGRDRNRQVELYAVHLPFGG